MTGPGPDAAPGPGGGVAVLASAPALMIAVERSGDGVRDIHVHPGGQGVWVARMASRLDGRTTLVAALGGESGLALRGLIGAEGIGLHEVPVSRPSAVWISDDREGESATVADLDAPELARHESDELANAMLAHGLDSAVAVLTGGPPGVLGAERYRGLAHDLHELGAIVVVDAAVDQVVAACEAGVALVKLAHDDMIEAGLAEGGALEQLVAGARELRDLGAEAVIVSRAERPMIALLGDDRILEIPTPDLGAANHRGAGDSITGAAAAALAAGEPIEDALRLGAAAGAVNVTRQGLGSGHAETIRRLARRLEPRDLGRAPGPAG